jgi:hypothetical protein
MGTLDGILRQADAAVKESRRLLNRPREGEAATSHQLYRSARHISWAQETLVAAPIAAVNTP